MNTIDTTGDSMPAWLPPRDTQETRTRTRVRRFDDGMASPNGHDRSLDIREATTTRADTNRLAAWGLASVFVLSGYEWLLSGLDKVFSADFRAGLAGELGDAMDGNPNHWYVRFLADTVVPHTRAFAAVVEWGELAVALGLFLGAVAWVGGDRIPRRWARRFQLAACGALIGSAVMTANYYLMDGNQFPWLNTGAPFDEGLNIDGLLTLVSVAMLAVQLLAIRATAAKPRAKTARAHFRSRTTAVRQAA
jgi:hypothetical protein